MIKSDKIKKQIFEPKEKAIGEAQMANLLAYRPAWLPAPYASIQQGFDAIIKVFENVSYIGELRQRWFEIKKLLKGGLPDAIPAAMQAK